MLKFFSFPVLGMTIADTTNKKMYLFNNDKTKYQIVETSVMEEIYQDYKNVNTINKPYCVLVYGQVFKNRDYGIKPNKIITSEELEKILFDKEQVIFNE